MQSMSGFYASAVAFDLIHSKHCATTGGQFGDIVGNSDQFLPARG
jgi:hypothetical protein